MEQLFLDSINQHRGTIFKVCNLYCHENENKKDLFQEIILQLWKSFPSFRNDSNINTWIYRVALNTAISNFRRDSKRPERIVLNEDNLLIPDIPQFTDEKEDIGLLNIAIKQLSEIEKALIILYLDEKSYDEMAKILGISLSNVGARLNRIKTKLSKIIQSN